MLDKLAFDDIYNTTERFSDKFLFCFGKDRLVLIGEQPAGKASKAPSSGSFGVARRSFGNTISNSS